jgi:hypothetical protein
MPQHLPPPSNALEFTFLALQALVMAFLLFHDWVPLGRLNNLGAIRREDSLVRSVFVTLLPAVPAALGLFYSARYFGRRYPDWLEMLLWISYGVFILGMLRAWWIPYLLVPDKERAARYQVIFAGTHTFLPRRNGMAPDTLHTLFHLVTFTTVFVLFIRDRIMAS